MRKKESHIKYEIRDLIKKGLSYREVSVTLKISLGKVSYWAKPENREKALSKEKDKYIPKPRKKGTIDHNSCGERRKRTLKNRYNITPEEYDLLYTQQNGRCGICNKKRPKTGKAGLYIDHCHKTGRVRGLLCPGCNSALGKFGDDVKILKKAITYLEKNSTWKTHYIMLLV